MTVVWILLAATAGAIILLMNEAWTKSLDPVHPLLILSIPLAGMYVLQPGFLLLSDSQGLLTFLSIDRLKMVLLLNLVGVVALLVGALGPGKATVPKGRLRLVTAAKHLHRLWYAGAVAGFTGLVSYLYCIYSVGGFMEAYGRMYGGGWSELGYVREAFWLGVPGIAMISISKKRLTALDYFVIAVCTFPLLTHGLVGGRRGPTAASMLTLAFSRSIAIGWRPRLWQLILGISLLGVGMLFLLASRDAIYLGSNEKLDRGLTSYATSVGAGNEFIYGGAVVITSHLQGVHYYGRRYLTVVFIRPIPRQIFPEKYQFAAEWLKIPNLSEHGSNLGTGKLQFTRYMGWKSAVGSATGLIADLWLECSYLYVFALWAIGRLYWVGWNRAVLGNQFWVIGYVIMSALSFYLISQTLEAMLFRFLLAAGGVVGLWVVVLGKFPRFELRQIRRFTSVVSRR